MAAVFEDQAKVPLKRNACKARQYLFHSVDSRSSHFNAVNIFLISLLSTVRRCTQGSRVSEHRRGHDPMSDLNRQILVYVLFPLDGGVFS